MRMIRCLIDEEFCTKTRSCFAQFVVVISIDVDALPVCVEKQTFRMMTRESVAEQRVRVCRSAPTLLYAACLRKTRKAETRQRRISIRRDSEIKAMIDVRRLGRRSSSKTDAYSLLLLRFLQIFSVPLTGICGVECMNNQTNKKVNKGNQCRCISEARVKKIKQFSFFGSNIPELNKQFMGCERPDWQDKQDYQ